MTRRVGRDVADTVYHVPSMFGLSAGRQNSYICIDNCTVIALLIGRMRLNFDGGYDGSAWRQAGG